MILFLSNFICLWIVIVGQNITGPITPWLIRKQCFWYEQPARCTPLFYHCGSHCPTEQPPPPGLPCFRICVKGCLCKEGYIRDLATELCVDERYCPAPGDKNVVYSRCKANEQVYCPVFPLHPIDPLPKEEKCGCDCTPGYVCKDGYAKNSTGYCVLPEQCDLISIE